jgi:hypothetical protein
MSIRLRHLLYTSLITLGCVVLLAVWISHQFPALTHGPKSSVEVVEAMLRAPKRTHDEAWHLVRQRMEQAGVEVFLKSCDIPADCQQRLLAVVRGENFREVTVSGSFAGCNSGFQQLVPGET